MFAVLFAILRAFEASPLNYFGVGLFLFAVGLGQMLLFKGQRPRKASVVVGALGPEFLARFFLSAAI
jgi:hypothetical protein